MPRGVARRASARTRAAPNRPAASSGPGHRSIRPWKVKPTPASAETSMEPMPRLSPASPPRTPVRRAAKFQPKARKPLPRGPRLLTYALVFVAVGLLVDAVFGDRGLLDTMRAERQNAALAERIDRLRDENARLREE